jgi:hypothetical protein
MSGAAALLLNFRVNAPSIVANPQAKQVFIVPNLGLDPMCMGVLKCIQQHLAGDAVDFAL